jgi:hypothetical protein
MKSALVKPATVKVAFTNWALIKKEAERRGLKKERLKKGHPYRCP